MLTNAVHAEEIHGGCYGRFITGLHSPQSKPHQGGFDSLWQKGQQVDGHVEHVAQLAQQRGHELALRGLSHTLYRRKQQHGAKNLPGHKKTAVSKVLQHRSPAEQMEFLNESPLETKLGFQVFSSHLCSRM